MSTKYKKQYRLFDVYRYISTGEKSKIMGIKDYTIEQEVLTTICINDWPITTDITDVDGAISEAAIKIHIKNVNKLLRNCKRPGPKAGYKK